MKLRNLVYEIWREKIDTFSLLRAPNIKQMENMYQNLEQKKNVLFK